MAENGYERIRGWDDGLGGVRKGRRWSGRSKRKRRWREKCKRKRRWDRRSKMR